MEIHDAQTNGNIFNKADQDLHNEQYQLRVGHNINSVENLFLGGTPMTSGFRTSIAMLLSKEQISYEELQTGAQLTDEEFNLVKNALEPPPLSAVKKIADFLNVPESALINEQGKMAVTINIEHLQIQGGVVSIGGDQAFHAKIIQKIPQPPQ